MTAEGERRRRRRPGLWLVLAVGGVLVLRRRRRSAAQPPPAPTEQAVLGQVSGAVPSVADHVQAQAPAPRRPRLVAVHGGSLAAGAVHESEEVLLPVGRVVVGRAEDVDVRLEDRTVSPRHAVLDVGPQGEVTVRDPGALNGVAVDGVLVTQARLHDGNRLDLGESQLVFRLDPAGDDGGRQGGELGEQRQQRQQGRD